jgi:chemotaxis protein methyltransferase CheR
MDCTAFLQWSLPQRGLRWAGFRKVRHQVCKRLKRRMAALELGDFDDYRARLEADPLEWRNFDDCCHITISRFYRDRAVFDALRRRVLPDIAARAKAERRDARAWSAGCASGEEPYTLRILWDLEMADRHPGVALSITATDIDRTMLTRAQRGCYAKTSLRELPAQLLAQAFDAVGPQYCVKPRHRAIRFLAQDLQSQAPADRFDLILCRYVAFTYFAPALQQQVLGRMLERLLPRGYLVIGTHENLPATAGLAPLDHAPQIFQGSADDVLRLPGGQPPTG